MKKSIFDFFSLAEAHRQNALRSSFAPAQAKAWSYFATVAGKPEGLLG